MSEALQNFIAAGGHAQVQAATSGLGGVSGASPKTLGDFVGKTIADGLTAVSGKTSRNEEVAGAMLESLKAAGAGDEGRRQQMEAAFFKVTRHNMAIAGPQEQENILAAARKLDAANANMGNFDMRKGTALEQSAEAGAKSFFAAAAKAPPLPADPAGKIQFTPEELGAFEIFHAAVANTVKAAYQKEQLNPGIDPALPNKKSPGPTQQR